MIRWFCEYIKFPEDATRYLCDSFSKITCIDDFFKAMDLYFCDDSDEHNDILDAISEKYGVHRYTVNMLFLILCARPLKYIYHQKNIPEAIYIDAMSDVKSKLQECKKMHDVWGTSVLWWFKRFFRCELFALGRLQYEKTPLDFDYKNIAKKGDVVLNCHIPSGGPLTAESVKASLDKAYDFYGVTGNMIVYCKSWLLYPQHYELFPEKSNLRKFYELFDVVKSEEAGSLDLWRIFNKDKFEDISADELNTELQKNFYNYLAHGGAMGVGEGILVYSK